jgi:hypothetical protein
VTTKKIYYRKVTWKYVTDKEARFQTSIRPARTIVTPFIALRTDGLLIVKAKYAWDGPSGPTWDRKSNMRASLGHDALWQLFREGHLNRKWIKASNRDFKKWLIEDGMWEWYAQGYYIGVSNPIALKNTKPTKEKIYSAP